MPARHMSAFSDHADRMHRERKPRPHRRSDALIGLIEPLRDSSHRDMMPAVLACVFLWVLWLSTLTLGLSAVFR